MSESPQPMFAIERIYIKDLSVEVPNAPDVFRDIRTTQPEIEVNIDTAVRNLQGNTFEVTLTIHVDADVAKKKCFILELAYSAFVELAPDLPDEHKAPILLIEIPRQLFPFVRQLVSAMTGQSGFPPMMLDMIDFAAVYRQRYGEGQPPMPDPAPAVH